MKSHSERGMPGRRRTEREGRGGCAAGGGGGGSHSWIQRSAQLDERAGSWHSWRGVQGMA